MAEAVEDLPVYKQIRRCIAERIERGDYPTGSMIPSENELAEEFGTTRLTIRSAMDELVKSGQIRRVQGKGAFVGHKWFDEHARKGGFRQSVLASGATPSVRILARSKRYAGPYYADLFGIGEDDLLYSVRRLNCIDGEPVSIEMTLIPCLLFPGIEDVDISVFSLYETYDMLGRKPDKSIEKVRPGGTADCPAHGLAGRGGRQHPGRGAGRHPDRQGRAGVHHGRCDRRAGGHREFPGPESLHPHHERDQPVDGRSRRQDAGGDQRVRKIKAFPLGGRWPKAG